MYGCCDAVFYVNVYGYRTVQGSRGDISKSVIVDDVWGNDNIVISNIFVDFFVYFNV